MRDLALVETASPQRAKFVHRLHFVQSDKNDKRTVDHRESVDIPADTPKQAINRWRTSLKHSNQMMIKMGKAPIDPKRWNIHSSHQKLITPDTRAWRAEAAEEVTARAAVPKISSIADVGKLPWRPGGYSKNTALCDAVGDWILTQKSRKIQRNALYVMGKNGMGIDKPVTDEMLTEWLASADGAEGNTEAASVAVFVEQSTLKGPYRQPAMNEGWQAAKMGKTKRSNPHDKGTAAHDAWHDGHMAFGLTK